MKYNTTPFTNIDSEVFECGFEGERWLIQPGEVRYFPTFLAEHFAKHLSEKLMDKALNSRTGKLLNREAFMAETMPTMLGEEMDTYKEEEEKPFRQLIDEHERAVLEMLAREEREKREKILEAKKIVENNVRKITPKTTGKVCKIS